ncbi:hypothetical protein Y032_0425g1237 [Ancylostoma ceylanicum]|uniref:Uncharacterized protein n=1 Tax=Ancylostoma ceylanicum TaxID=53326 RepID=A0A016X0T0_9BILA|nr:hypothetical protein Y032_0425g1237 [Ancylostoma ceylanicum]
MLSSRVLSRLGGARGLLTGPVGKPRHDPEGHPPPPPPPITQLSEHELHLKDTENNFDRLDARNCPLCTAMLTLLYQLALVIAEGVVIRPMRNSTESE